MPDVAHGLRANHNWLCLWFSQAIALFGFHVFNVTVTLWVATSIAAGEPWAPAAVSGALACAAAPIILVGPIAGVFADRWDNRRTMMATDVARAGLVASLIALPLVGGSAPVAVQLAIVYAVVTAVSICAQFFMPARFGLVATIIAEPDQSRALGLLQASSNTAAVLGPPVGAVLFTVGVEWALAVNAIALVFSFALIRAIHTPPREAQQESPGFVAEFLAGLQYFISSRVLVVVVIAASFSMIGLGALNTLNVFFVEHNLAVDPAWLGSVSAALGAGSILGALLAAWRASQFGEERFFWIGLLVAGTSIVVYSALTSLPAALVVIVFVGLPIGAINAVLGPIVLRTTPKEFLGRMLTVINPSLQTASLIGMAISGALASTALTDLDATIGAIHVGAYNAVFALAGALIVAAGLWSMRRLRRLTPAEPDQQNESEPSQPSTAATS